MKQRITYHPISHYLAGITAFATLLVAASGCDMTENRVACPTVGNVVLSFDWSQVPDGTSSPNEISVHFFHEEGPAITRKTDDKGGCFPLPRGHYSLLVYNEDGVAVTLRTSENKLENNKVSVIAVPPPTGISPLAENFDRYIGQPQILYSVADISPDFFVEVGETLEKNLQPENHIRQAKVMANVMGDFAEVTNCIFELTGVVQSLNLHDYSFQDEPAITAATATRTGQGYGWLFTLLGKHQKVNSYLLVHMDCRSGTHFDFKIDVSEALAKINEVGVFSSTITLELEVLDKHELGFDIELIGWDYKEGGNIDIDFNE